MRTTPALLAPLLALVLAPAAVAAKPKEAAAGKATRACGVTVLPLSEGNSWSYSFVPPKDAAAPEIARISPPAAKSFVITVKSIETKGPDTVITLEEKVTYELQALPGQKKGALDERVITSTITCNAKKLDISPESFFFAAEPGGFGGMTIDKFERKGTSWQLTSGNFGEAEWPEDLAIQWTQVPAKGIDTQYGSGKIEMERRFTPLEPEQLNTKAGSYRAEKLAVKTTGRVTLNKPLSPDLKPAEMPADWINQLWFVPGTGVVQTLNRYAHMYQLVESTVK
ncbi:MAG: hypothetical protein SFX73_24340 [Kofleriaceae bacterium]|nr:hypothetical protein [Kofleriaceae bacterium]